MIVVREVETIRHGVDELKEGAPANLHWQTLLSVNGEFAARVEQPTSPCHHRR